jgi:hypothetical protein
MKSYLAIESLAALVEGLIISITFERFHSLADKKKKSTMIATYIEMRFEPDLLASKGFY